MLKFLIPFAVLLNFAACRFVDENDGKFCEAETERFKFCTETYANKDISQSLGNCFVSHKKFPLPKGFSSTVVLCVKKVLDSTDCSTEQKVGLERGARAVADLYDQSDMVFGDENYAKNFDLKFDPRKYGL